MDCSLSAETGRHQGPPDGQSGLTLQTHRRTAWFPSWGLSFGYPPAKSALSASAHRHKRATHAAIRGFCPDPGSETASDFSWTRQRRFVPATLESGDARISIATGQNVHVRGEKVPPRCDVTSLGSRSDAMASHDIPHCLSPSGPPAPQLLMKLEDGLDTAGVWNRRTFVRSAFKRRRLPRGDFASQTLFQSRLASPVPDRRTVAAKSTLPSKSDSQRLRTRSATEVPG
jgi:hypothetical protein